MWNGKEVRDNRGRFTSYWKKIKWFCKRVVIGVGVCFIALGLYVGGQVNVKLPELIPVVEAEDTLAPILERIAKCESPSGHTKNGKVVFARNTNGTTDIGKFQINTIWLPQAAELGLNLSVEEDNTKFAEWLYANRGTSDWFSSSKCWQK